VVEEQNLHLASVVGVNDTGASVNEVLRRQPRARGDAAVLGRELAKASPFCPGHELGSTYRFQRAGQC
jgi:hypothetical protein